MGFLDEVRQRNDENYAKKRDKYRLKKLEKENRKKVKNIDEETKKWVDDEINNVKDELFPILGEMGLNRLKLKVSQIVIFEGKDEASDYLKQTRDKAIYYNEKQDEYIIESQLADKIYKAYVTDGISRLEKINGRFMAAQNMKLDILIEQNTRIIQLLEEIAKK